MDQCCVAPWKTAWDENRMGGSPSLLILDAYPIHQMGSVVNWIQSMGIEVVHIPVGCTYLYQPIDSAFNEPIKSRIQEKWEQWMTEGGGLLKAKQENLHVKWWQGGSQRCIPMCLLKLGRILGRRQSLSGFQWFIF